MTADDGRRSEKRRSSRSLRSWRSLWHLVSSVSSVVEDVAAATVFLISERLAGHLIGVALPLAGEMEGRLLHPP